MEIKTTRDLGIWFTNIRECKNDVIMSNPINLKYLHKSWVLIDDILKEIKTIDKWHSSHRTKNLIKVLEDAISSNSSSDKFESFNKDLEVSASPTPKESQKPIPSLNPDIRRNF